MAFDLSNPTTLLLENNTYISKQKNILSAEEQLVLDTSPLELENVACGTECMCLITDFWKETEATGIKFRDFTCNEVDMMLTRVMQSINKTSQDVADALTLEDEPAGEFSFQLNDKHNYGINQRGPRIGLNLFGWIIGEDKEIYDFVRSHPGYENYTDYQIHQMLSRLDEGGCTYASASNVIFNSFKGREAEFEKTFGFPMYKDNGQPNYNALLVDYYCDTRDRIFLDCQQGLDSYATEKGYYYKNHPDEYQACYGEPFYDSNNNPSKNWRLNCYNEAVMLKKSGKTCIAIDIGGYGADSSVINRLEHYCDEHGLSMTYGNASGAPMTNEDIQKSIDSGYTVVFGASNFNLEYKNGLKIDSGKEYSSHSMTITETNEDGRYTVSSWGDKLYFDPVNNADNMKASGYYFIKIN